MFTRRVVGEGLLWETTLAQADDSDIAQVVFELWRSLWKRATVKAKAGLVAKRRETALLQHILCGSGASVTDSPLTGALHGCRESTRSRYKKNVG